MIFEILVDGMTCGGCELHVEKAVSEIDGVKKVKANNATSKVIINTDDWVTIENSQDFLDTVSNKIKDSGYEYKGKYIKRSNNFSLKQWVGIIIIFAALYLVVKETGILNRLPVIKSTMSYGFIFIIGLLTSVHCIGMCGGINLSVSITGLTKKHKFNNAILYNLGRVISYTIIGGIVGAIGSVLSITGSMQGIIVGIAGIFMILMAIKMFGLFPIIDKIIPKLPKVLTNKIIGSGTGRGPFIIGFLNGFMPCGPLQSIQIYALSTGSAFSGALSMFLFSLGTVPLMLGFGSIASVLPKKFHSKILKISALLVLLLGAGMVIRGMNLNGVSLPGSNSSNLKSENVRIAKISGDKQYVTTIMHSGEYEPFIVQAGIPVVWTIVADEDQLNGCNNPLTVPKYDIRFQMEPGENIIEFTPPADATTITYTCWMGMITSGISVVEDLNSIDSSQIEEAAALSAESSGGCGGGCCSTGGDTGDSTGNILEYTLPSINTENIGLASIQDEIQIATVNITGDGFEPGVIVLQKDIPTTWLINGTQLDEKNYRLLFPAYNNRGIELTEGENVIEIMPQLDFQYYSWRQDFGGYVKVVDDLTNINLDEIKKDVEIFNDKFKR
ncbi:MAG: sulfite exporter TauE/SafE family protein [Spirochaetaceae bacterium]